MDGSVSTRRSFSIKVGINARYLYDPNLRGFNRYTTCLITALQQLGDLELLLFTDPSRPLHPAFTSLLGPTTRVSMPGGRKALLWEQAGLPSALRREEVDVFHAPADGGLPRWKTCRHVLTYHRALDASVAYWVARGELPGTLDAYGVATHGVRGWWARQRHETLRRLYLESADKVIAVSEFGKWELVTLLGVPEEKVEVVYLAADESFSPRISQAQVDAVRHKYGLPLSYLLFVGGFDPWKNVHGLIRAFAEARRAGLDQGLVVVGTGGNRAALERLAADLDLAAGHEVVFLVGVRDDLPALYRGATAYITLSWGESFCLPAVEAMSCGTAVIASRLGAIPEILAGAGVLVDPRSAAEARDAMLRVAGDESFRAELESRSLKRAAAFSWQHTAERTASVYRRLARA